MSLSPIGSAVFELLSHKHTDIHTDIQTDILLLYSKDNVYEMHATDTHTHDIKYIIFYPI